MATNRTDSLIGASGGDYTSIQSWEDDIGVGLGSSANLVTDDYDHYGWLKAEEFDEDATIAGHTCDATHKIYLAADSAGGTVAASQHSHTKVDAALMDDSSRALTYNSSYASIASTAGYGSGLRITDSNFQFSRIQYKKGVSVPNGKGIDFSSANGVMDRCLLEQTAKSNSYRLFYMNTTAQLHSSIVINTSSAALSEFNTNTYVYNCTFARSSTSSLSATATQMGTAYQAARLANCAFFGGGAGTNFIAKAGSGAWSELDYNATDHSDLSEDSGEGANNTYSLTQSDQFTAVDNTDWRVKSGHGLGVGTNKTATVAVDIFGVAFETDTSIVGCEQYAASGTTSTTSGTTTESITETTMSATGGTTILTLTNDTWVADDGTFAAVRQAIIDKQTSAQTETFGWNNEVRDKAAVTDVARTDDNTVTITWGAAASYDITAQETITPGIPAAALVTSTIDVVSSPTFTVDFVATDPDIFNPAQRLDRGFGAQQAASLGGLLQ